MLTSRLKVIATVLMAAVAAFLLATPVGAANNAMGAMKLEGAWIAKVPGTPVQWTYVLSPDPSGRSASFHGSIEVGFGNPLGSDRTSPLLGAVVMTGPTTGKFNSVWYGISNIAGVVYIGVDTGDIEFVGGKILGTHNLVFYLPDQDADEDGLPDPGEMPAFGYPGPVHTIDTRLPLPR
jgi:hypothetical protein